MFKSSLDISIANVASGFSNANVSGSKVAREATEMGHFAPKKAKMEEKPHEQEHLSEVQKNLFGALPDDFDDCFDKAGLKKLCEEDYQAHCAEIAEFDETIRMSQYQKMIQLSIALDKADRQFHEACNKQAEADAQEEEIQLREVGNDSEQIDWIIAKLNCANLQRDARTKINHIYDKQMLIRDSCREMNRELRAFENKYHEIHQAIHHRRQAHYTAVEERTGLWIERNAAAKAPEVIIAKNGI